MTQQMQHENKMVIQSDGKTDLEICKNISKKQYRSEMGIISEILCLTMDSGRGGAIISSIARGANLSHYAVTEKCQKLIDAGMVESTSTNRNHTFVITEKGMQFVQELQKFIEIAQSLKVRF
jgi:predicted transcriptional regulator